MLKILNSIFVIKNEIEGEQKKNKIKFSEKYNFLNYLEDVNVGYVLLNTDYLVVTHNKIVFNFLSNDIINTSRSVNFKDKSVLTDSVKTEKSVSVEGEVESFKSSFISDCTDKKCVLFFEELFTNLIEIDEHFLPDLNAIYDMSKNLIPHDLISETPPKFFKKINPIKLSEFIEKIKLKLKEEIFYRIGVSKLKIQRQIKYLEIKMRMIKSDNKEIFYEIMIQDVTKTIEAKLVKDQMIYKSLGLAKVAHDFKNPLLSLISLIPTDCASDSDSYISSADDDDNDDDSEKEKIIIEKKSSFIKRNSKFFDECNITDRNNMIKNFCSYMLMLIEDFNLYAKMDLEKKKSNQTTIIEKFSNGEVEIRPILEFCVNIFKIRQYNEKDKQKIDIKLVVDENVPKKIAINETKLKQVMINIISNAYKFTISGEIIVTAKVNFDEEFKKFFRISIQDTGVGISKEDQLTLFSPFKMIDNSKRLNQNGSGLGLLIIKEILQKMNSKIEFISEPGLGSTFWFDIPINGAINKFCTKTTFSDIESTLFIDQNFVFTESLTNLFKSLNKNYTFTSDFSHMDDLESDNFNNKIKLDNQMHNKCPKIEINTTCKKEDNNDNNTERIWKISKSINSNVGRNKSRKETLLLAKKEFHGENFNSKNLMRFLICDDEEIPKIAAQKIIINICKEKMIEYDISFAKNGIECLYILHQKSYRNEAIDILLIDDNMSVMNGRMTIKILNDLINEKQMPNLTIFIVTSQDDSKNKKILMQNGCDDVISKPITRDKISQILGEFRVKA